MWQIIASESWCPYFWCSLTRPDFLHDDVLWLHEALNGAEIEHRFDDLPGYGHEFALWDMELKKFIEWLPRTDYYADKGIHQI